MTLATLLLTASSSLAAEAAPDPVVNGAQPVVSPRGDLIAFLSNRDGADDVYVIGVNGRGEKRLTHTHETETGLQWSANGKEIVFSVLTEDTSHIYAIDPKGKHSRELGAVTGRTPMLAPDGRHVLAMAGTWTATQLMVSALDGSNAQTITDGSSIAWNNHWSPDGKRIAFTGRNQPDGELAVFVMNADGTKRFQVSKIPPKEGGAQWPVWSPNSVNLAVQVNSRVEKGSSHIWLVSVAFGDKMKLAAHDRAYLDETPSWFPDGKHIAFQSNRTGRMEVWVMKVDGTDARQVTGL